MQMIVVVICGNQNSSGVILRETIQEKQRLGLEKTTWLSYAQGMHVLAYLCSGFERNFSKGAGFGEINEQ